MAINKETIKKTAKDFVYAQIGIASLAGKLICKKVDEFITKGKEVASSNKDIDAVMKQVFDSEEEAEARKQQEQHVNEVIASLTPEELETLKSKLQ